MRIWCKLEANHGVVQLTAALTHHCISGTAECPRPAPNSCRFPRRQLVAAGSPVPAGWWAPEAGQCSKGWSAARGFQRSTRPSPGGNGSPRQSLEDRNNQLLGRTPELQCACYCMTVPLSLLKRGSQSTADPHSSSAPCSPPGCSTVRTAFSITADLQRDSASLRHTDNHQPL